MFCLNPATNSPGHRRHRGRRRALNFLLVDWCSRFHSIILHHKNRWYRWCWHQASYRIWIVVALLQIHFFPGGRSREQWCVNVLVVQTLECLPRPPECSEKAILHLFRVNIEITRAIVTFLDALPLRYQAPRDFEFHGILTFWAQQQDTHRTWVPSASRLLVLGLWPYEDGRPKKLAMRAVVEPEGLVRLDEHDSLSLLPRHLGLLLLPLLCRLLHDSPQITLLSLAPCQHWSSCLRPVILARFHLAFIPFLFRLAGKLEGCAPHGHKPFQMFKPLRTSLGPRAQQASSGEHQGMVGFHNPVCCGCRCDYLATMSVEQICALST
mmetsp:Transcript_7037/g.17887  ORF Transcript_7037/g.17887 Transcript_7037/m.17887 type:complete len:324 (+) Transcript_7037:1742-2713(+)